MVPCHSCHIYGAWKSKEVRGRIKVIIWEVKKQRGRSFFGIDPSRHHVIILGTDIPFLHSFL